MFIGHYAVGFGAKRLAPTVSLGSLILSVQLLDLIWPILLLLGVEHVRIEPGNTPFTPLNFYDYPFSHSLVTTLLWSLVFGLIYYGARKNSTGALVLGFGVLSHWVLDFISHRPDLPIAPWMNVYGGLGLWNSITATIVVEGLLFVLGVFIYARTTVATDRTGNVAFWALIGFLALIYIGNISSPPPPDEKAIGYVSLLLWLFVPWGYWIDRHRRSVV